ncbi:MAG TPA: hypothetical protein DCZ94_13895 [Lentisphaeria bacterium]|nr:MAG: hypothetical protein A2X48_03715 [Lentisphaerae bacterium GWF2_49_21]HBC88037.1 hypothetical protein [Lentisphaeria bacterium]
MAVKITRSEFSLIEILVVIGILVILMSITAPEFARLIRGQGAEFAARTLSTKLNLARSYAISKRQYVAILMPQCSGKPAATSFPDSHFHNSYRACIVAKNGSNYYFQQWIQGETWELLPEGVAIVEVDDDDGVNTTAGYLTPSNGTITTISPSPLPATSPNKGVDCSDIGGSSSATDFAAVVFKPNGLTPSGRYIELAEAKYIGASLTMTNRNSQSYVSIKIDQTTGRISYGNK